MTWQEYLDDCATTWGLINEERETLLAWLPVVNSNLEMLELQQKLQIQEDALKKRLQKIYNKYEKSTGLVLTGKKSKQLLIFLRQEYQRGPKSYSRKIAELLWALDYKQQSGQFDTWIDRFDPAGAFLIRASQLKIQQWLVKRLVRKVPGNTKAKKFPIIITPTHPIRLGYDSIWSTFLGNPNSVDSQNSDSRKAAMESLFELAQNQPVIIVIHGFNRLSQEQIADLCDFWCCLAQKIYDARNRSSQSRLLLFLVDDEVRQLSSENSFFKFVTPDEAEDPYCPLALDVLIEIPKHELKGWLKDDAIYLELINRIGEEKVDSVIENHELWKSDPYETLNQVCFALGLQGAVDIENYWNL
jgi:hypothetical protein